MGISRRVRASGALSMIEDHMAVVVLITVTSISGIVLAALGSISFFSFDEQAAGWSFLALSCAYAIGWLVFAVTGSVRSTAVIAVASSITVNVYLHVEIGGYAYSGGMMMWVITLTMVAAVFIGRRATIVLATAFVLLAILLGFLEQDLAASRTPPDPAMPAAMFAIVLAGNLIVLTPLFVYLLGRLTSERAKAEDLLLNVLPSEVARELKVSGSVAPRRYEDVSVLFADIVDFTPMSARTDPALVVDQLNRIFTAFDEITARHGCEKIRTIGDAYMVAAGVPIPRADHARALAAVALEMVDYARSTPFELRIGINSGPVVAGVIGTSKFQYDVWGETVNTASRLESHGEPGRVQVSLATRDLIDAEYVCVPRGTVEMKGIGRVHTWFVVGRRTRTPPDA